MKTKKPTIYDALREKLGREPTHTEIFNDIRRILQSAKKQK